MKPKAGVVVFPGSNCDRDTYWALEKAGFDVRYVWYKDTNIWDLHLIVLPGGFSYGDYLRPGVLASFSPVVKALWDFKGYVMGICNGFQILTEAGLLPGALTRNINGNGDFSVVFRYEENPNGSEDSIAAIISADGRIFGTMPHPERASDRILGSEDGLGVFLSVLNALKW
jgi:phosphoribosylformylglycinamidine (FGAM) synthase-like amidotransferase family enzyme